MHFPPCSMVRLDAQTTCEALVNVQFWALAAMAQDRKCPLCMAATNIGMAMCTQWAMGVAEQTPCLPLPPPPACFVG